MHLNLPTINSNGTVEQQLAEIRSYIYRNNEEINVALSNLSVDKLWQRTADALTVASDIDSKERSDILSQYRQIRDLIIKTADTIIKTDEQWSMAMNGSYLAKSQFGEYLLNTSVEINGNSTGFSQLYTYSSELSSDYNSYKTYQQNFIKQGLLDDSDSIPVYGIDIGLLTSEFNVTDESGNITQVMVDANKKIRITPDRLAFWNSNYEVAYITGNSINFPQANITGGSININGAFKVNNKGEITATKGTFSGTLSGSTLLNCWNNTNSATKIRNGILTLYENDEKIYEINPLGYDFYKRLVNDGDVETWKLNQIIRVGHGEHQGIATLASFPHGSFIVLAGCYSDGVDELNKEFTPLLTWSRGNNVYVHGDNIYTRQGFHFADTVDMHDNRIINAVLNNVSIGNVTANGASGITRNIIISAYDSNGNEVRANLFINNGIITGCGV